MSGYKHGGWTSNRHLYTVWSGMLSRCRNKNHKQYKDYGGRGIQKRRIEVGGMSSEELKALAFEMEVEEDE